MQVPVPDGPGHVDAVAAAEPGAGDARRRGGLRPRRQGQLPHRQGRQGRARQLGHPQGRLSIHSVWFIRNRVFGTLQNCQNIEGQDLLCKRMSASLRIPSTTLNDSGMYFCAGQTNSGMTPGFLHLTVLSRQGRSVNVQVYSCCLTVGIS